MPAKKPASRAKRPARPASSGGPLDRADPPRKAIRKELEKFKRDDARRKKAQPKPPGKPTLSV